jgi:hypothetical protein
MAAVMRAQTSRRLLRGGDDRPRRGAIRAGVTMRTDDEQQPERSSSCRAAEPRVLSSSLEERLARALATALVAHYRAGGESE